MERGGNRKWEIAQKSGIFSKKPEGLQHLREIPGRRREFPVRWMTFLGTNPPHTNTSDSISVEMGRVETDFGEGNDFPSFGIPSKLNGLSGHRHCGRMGVVAIFMAILALLWCKNPFKVTRGVPGGSRLCKVEWVPPVQGNEPNSLARPAVTGQRFSHSPKGGWSRFLGIFHPKISMDFLGRIWRPNSA